MNKRGVDLIVTVLPFAVELELDFFYPDEYHGEPVFDLFRIKTIKEYLEHDIEVVDIYDEMIQNRMNYPLFQQAVCDWHQTSYTNALLAKALAHRLKRYNVDSSSLNENDFVIGSRIINKVDSPFIKFQENDLQFMFNDKNSPFILTGDSFTYRPTEDSSIAAFLSMETKRFPAEVSRLGSSGSRKLADIAKLKPDFWKNRKALILIIAPQSYNTKWIEKDFQTIADFKKGTSVFSKTGLSLLDGAFFKTLQTSSPSQLIPMTYSIGVSDSGISFASPGSGTQYTHFVEWDTDVDYKPNKDYIIECVLTGPDMHFGDIYITPPSGKTYIENAHGTLEKIYCRFHGKDTKDDKLSMRFILPSEAFLKSITINEIDCIE